MPIFETSCPDCGTLGAGPTPYKVWQRKVWVCCNSECNLYFFTYQRKIVRLDKEQVARLEAGLPPFKRLHYASGGWTRSF
jgi:hypothetical protein